LGYVSDNDRDDGWMGEWVIVADDDVLNRSKDHFLVLAGAVFFWAFWAALS